MAINALYYSGKKKFVLSYNNQVPVIKNISLVFQNIVFDRLKNYFAVTDTVAIFKPADEAFIFIVPGLPFWERTMASTRPE